MDSECDPKFRSLLRSHFSRDELDRTPASVIGLWGDLRIAYLNRAWFEFARRNGGMPTITDHWGLGSSYLEAISRPLRPFFSNLFASTPDAGDDVHPGAHEYQCPSAERHRRFHMDVYTLPGREGYVIVNSLVAERLHSRSVQEPHPPERAHYTEPSGLIRQCSHCRRVRRIDGGRWDWVPAWVAQMPSNVSHGVCDLCLRYYYPDDSGDLGDSDHPDESMG